MPVIKLNDKFKGCLVGSAIGDALGYEVEFTSMAGIQQRFGNGGIRDLVLTELDGKKQGLYSDDTQMARAVAEGLIRSGRLGTLDGAAEEIAEEFVAWSRGPDGGHRAPGNACMRGCRKLAEGKLPWRECGGPNNNKGAGGCGSVMRSHPYALFYFDNFEAATFTAGEHSRLTHGAPLAQAASAALAAGVYFALRNKPLDFIASAMQHAAYVYDEGTGDMLVLAENFAQDPHVETATVLDRWRGWAGHEAIAAALFVFMRYAPNGFSDVVIRGANSPGDSDSIAAIAGALAGAWFGFDIIQNEKPSWVANVEKTEQIQNLAVRLRQAASASETLYLLEKSHAEEGRSNA